MEEDKIVEMNVDDKTKIQIWKISGIGNFLAFGTIWGYSFFFTPIRDIQTFTLISFIVGLTLILQIAFWQNSLSQTIKTTVLFLEVLILLSLIGNIYFELTF